MCEFFNKNIEKNIKSISHQVIGHWNFDKSCLAWMLDKCSQRER